MDTQEIHRSTTPSDAVNAVNVFQAGPALATLAPLSTTGLRYVGLLNAVALFLLLAFWLGIVGGDVDPPDLQQPLELFVAGVVACAGGLLFAWLAHLGLYRQLAAGRNRRTHWLPVLLTLACYVSAVAAFVLGCWGAIAAGGNDAQGDNASYTSHRSASAGGAARRLAAQVRLDQLVDGIGEHARGAFRPEQLPR
jgi:hypothetical protein